MNAEAVSKVDAWLAARDWTNPDRVISELADTWATLKGGRGPRGYTAGLEAALRGILLAIVRAGWGREIQVNPPRTGKHWLIYAVVGIEHQVELVGRALTEVEALVDALPPEGYQP